MILYDMSNLEVLREYQTLLLLHVMSLEMEIVSEDKFVIYMVPISRNSHKNSL